MKKLLLVATVLGAFAAAPVGAADLPVKASAPATVWNWTGFYIGGNAGGGMASTHFDDPCLYCSSATPTRGFVTGGVQAGYNYQFGNGLVGIEADVNGNSTFKNSVVGGNDPRAMTAGLKADVTGTIRARAGAVIHNTLFYVTGGAAWADVKQTGIEFNNQTSSANFGLPTGTTANASGTLWGSVIGAGVEFALNQNWTVGGEFLHTMYQDRDARILRVDGTTACGGDIPVTNCVIRSQLTTDVARLRVNYKFGGDPVVAQAYAPAGGMYRKAPVAAALYSWTGFYVGGNAGGGLASGYFTDPCFYCSTATPTGGFFTGGVQAGYNYQFGNGLVGIEADVNGISNSGLKSVIGGNDTQAMTVGLKADVGGTIRARAGLVVNNALVYATGGAAWANVRQTGVDFNNVTGNANFGLPTGVTANASGTLWGGVIGAGVEFALGQNWSVGGEFLHTVYQDRGANVFDPTQANGNACLIFNPLPQTNCVIRSQLTTDVARVRVNYKFGNPGGADPATAYQPAVIAYNWTGFYVGGNAGGGMAASAFTDPCLYCSAATPTRGYFTGGVQAGYNYQFGRGLVGIEADVNGNSAFKNSVIGGADPRMITVGLKADLSGTIRARAGLVVNNALAYVTAGAAWADVKQTGVELNNRVDAPNFGTPTGITANANGTLWGGVIGAGVEFALNQNWSVGGEFLHTMYRDRDANILSPDGTNACPDRPATNCVIRSQLTTDVARVRVNYKFGETVVAKY
jgi:opacity protein-like surface antigen